MKDLMLPVVARLYYTGTPPRRYKRASTRNGPGEPLSFTSVAEAAIRRERGKVDELAMLTRRLAHSLRKAAPGNDLSDAALDYLRKHDLAGSPLRDQAGN